MSLNNDKFYNPSLALLYFVAQFFPFSWMWIKKKWFFLSEVFFVMLIWEKAFQQNSIRSCTLQQGKLWKQAKLFQWRALRVSFSADGENYDVHIQALNWDSRMRLHTMLFVRLRDGYSRYRSHDKNTRVRNVAPLKARIRRKVSLSFFPSLFIEGIYQNDKTKMKNPCECLYE